MTSRARTHHTIEQPMDFEFTSRPSSHTKPVWAAGEEDPSTPRKRSLNDAYPPAPTFPLSPAQPTFGHNTNVPFLFQQPPPQSPFTHAWAPPPHFSPEKAFPQPELNDVDMSEASPPKVTHKSPEKEAEPENDKDRPLALGAMRRVYNSRRRAGERSRVRQISSRNGNGVEEEGSEDESDDEGRLTPVTQNTSNHYTLNLPGPAAPQSDLPYILLGYLQFFFNLSLILLFLYLLVQFILTVQRDVEHRISEYSMDIVQEIAQCAMHYKTNQCATNPIPALTQQCGSWRTCMDRDPTKVGRAKVGAELIAEVVNGFVEPISWKTLIFTLTSLSFLTVFINTLLSLYRAKHHPSVATSHAQHPPMPIPAFPIHNTPYHAPQYLPGNEWKDSWKSQNEVEETPSRRRRLEGGGAAKVK